MKKENKDALLLLVSFILSILLFFLWWGKDDSAMMPVLEIFFMIPFVFIGSVVLRFFLRKILIK